MLTLLAAVGGTAAVVLASAVSGSWEGTLALLPRFTVEDAAWELGLSFGQWEITSDSRFKDGAYKEQAFHAKGYLLGYRLTLEGKAVFSPQGRVLKHLYRTLGETHYHQLLWGPPGAHYRYGWLKGELPTAWGEWTAKAYRRANSTAEITYVYFPEAYTWDVEAGRWKRRGTFWAGVKEVAFIAGKVRLRALVEGTWRSRTEYNLRALFDPEVHGEPFSLAEEATCYLNAKYPQGWYLREPIDPAQVKVYLWRAGYTEFTLGFATTADDREPQGKLTITWADSGAGLGFSSLKVTYGAWTWCRGSGDLVFSLDPSGLKGFTASLTGLPLAFYVTMDLELSLTLTAQKLVLTPHWEGGHGCLSLFGNALWEDRTLSGLALYGVKAEGYIGPGRRWEVLWVLRRPPYPQPSWYRSADFEKVAATGEYEDGLVSLESWGYGPEGKRKLGLLIYFASGRAPLGLSRFRLESSFPLTADFKAGLVFQTDDPSTIPQDPSLALTWNLTFESP